MDMYTNIQNKLARVFFEEDFKTIIIKSVSQLNNPTTDYLDAEFIEFVFNQNKTFQHGQDTISPIHYLFLNMSSDLFKKISTLNLPWTKLTENKAHVLNFMCENPNGFDVADVIEWIERNNIDFFQMNQTCQFIDKLIKKFQLVKTLEKDQLVWYNYIYPTHSELLDETILDLVYYAHPSVVAKAIASGANLKQVFGTIRSSLLHLIFLKKFYTEQEFSEQDIEIADMLIENGCNINKENLNGHTPFEYAVKYIDSKWVLHYLRKGGNPHVIPKNGENLLFYFIKKQCDIDTFKELVGYGINYNLIDSDGFTLLHWATWFDLLQHIQYLNSLGLKDFCYIPNGKYSVFPKGLTPLHHVLLKCSEPTINYVIENADNLVTKKYQWKYQESWPKNYLLYYILPAHNYLINNNKLTKEQKVILYKKLAESIKKKDYANNQIKWFFESNLYEYPNHTLNLVNFVFDDNMRIKSKKN